MTRRQASFVLLAVTLVLAWTSIQGHSSGVAAQSSAPDVAVPQSQHAVGEVSNILAELNGKARLAVFEEKLGRKAMLRRNSPMLQGIWEIDYDGFRVSIEGVGGWGESSPCRGTIHEDGLSASKRRARDEEGWSRFVAQRDAMKTNSVDRQGEPLAVPRVFNVGYRVIDMAYPGGKEQDRTLTVAVWYPTTAQPGSFAYGGAASGNVAVGAAPLAGSGACPLLVFSHGYGGGGLGVVFLAEALASRGWVVAAPDHHDRHSAVRIRSGPVKDFDRRGLLKHAMQIASSGPEDRAEYIYRLDELKLVIDGMLACELFKDGLDAGRVAVGGHSFGGFAALGMSGAIRERVDTRIKAVLLFSTGVGGYLFDKDELSAVRVPSMLFLGEREKKEKRGRDMTMAQIAEKIFGSVQPPKYFLEVKGADHLSFNNRFTEEARARRPLGVTEEQTFDVIRRYSIAFLEKYVAGREDGAAVLEHGDPLLAGYLQDVGPPRVR